MRQYNIEYLIGVYMKKYVSIFCIALTFILGGCSAKEQNQFNVMEEELILADIAGEYDILFLTDTHVVVRDDSDSAQESENNAERYGMFEGEDGISSAKRFAEWIDYANKQEVDMVLLGGDIIDSPTKANTDYLEKQLVKLNMPYMYTLGNHDWTFPWEYMTEKGEEEYLPFFASYMNDNTAIHSWENDELMIIAVDNSSGQVNDAVNDEYEEFLGSGKPVIVMSHVPFLTQSVLTKAKETWNTAVVLGGGNYGGIYPDETSEKFLELTNAEESPVELVLAGHVHFYDRDYIDGPKQILQIVGGAGYNGEAVLIHIRGGRAD